jgi:hypothetical protein
MLPHNLKQNKMIALFIVPIVLVAFIGYYLGRNQERTEWKKLIKDEYKLKQEEQ